MQSFYRYIWILSVVFFLTSSEKLSAQESKKDIPQEVIKLGTVVRDSPSEELTSDAYFYNKEYGGKFAVKLCSTNSLTTAYGLSSVRIKRLVQNLTGIGRILKENISYVFGSDCLDDEKDLVAVELWWIPKEKQTPKFDKQFAPCQLKTTGFGENTDKVFNNDKQYAAALKDLAKKIRSVSDRSKLTGLVTAVYYNYYPRKLRKRVETAKKLLAQEIKDGLAVVEVKESYLPYISESVQSKLKAKEYPDVFYVQFEENGCI